MILSERRVRGEKGDMYGKIENEMKTEQGEKGGWGGGGEGRKGARSYENGREV